MIEVKKRGVRSGRRPMIDVAFRVPFEGIDRKKVYKALELRGVSFQELSCALFPSARPNCAPFSLWMVFRKPGATLGFDQVKKFQELVGAPIEDFIGDKFQGREWYKLLKNVRGDYIIEFDSKSKEGRLYYKDRQLYELKGGEGMSVGSILLQLSRMLEGRLR